MSGELTTAAGPPPVSTQATGGATTMRAVVLREPGQPVTVETVSLEPPRRGEVRVRVAAAGVCHSDLHLADGVLGRDRWPVVLGHEGAGVVDMVGDGVEELAVGDRVALCFIPSCGACRQCRAGRRTLCEPAGAASIAGTLLDGTTRLHGAAGEPLQHGWMVGCFAQYAVLAAGSAVPLPDGIPLWQAALIGCGVVTGYGAVAHAGVGIGSSVCVIGCGGVGLQVVAAARMAGAGAIVAVDLDQAKLEHARRRGATDVVDGSGGELVKAVRALTGGGVERSFEVVGRAETIRHAWDVLRPGGTATVVGVAPRGVKVEIPALELLAEKTLTGSFYGSADAGAAIQSLAALVLAGRLELADVVSDVIGLDGVQEAFERLRRGEGARSVVLIDEELAGRGL